MEEGGRRVCLSHRCTKRLREQFTVFATAVLQESATGEHGLFDVLAQSIGLSRKCHILLQSELNTFRLGEKKNQVQKMHFLFEIVTEN